MGAALDAGLEAIAVADHNSFEAVKGVKEAAAGRRLHVFTGTELSTVGGHMLALLPEETPLDELGGFLDSLGIDRAGWGDASTVAAGDTGAVLKKVVERGGLAIAAHVERWPSGFLETNQSRQVKRAIHESIYLGALEITVAHNKCLWNAGKMRGYPRPRACVQGSDAHALEEIGRRPVYVRMAELTLEALREGLRDYQAAVRFPDEMCLCHRGTD